MEAMPICMGCQRPLARKAPNRPYPKRLIKAGLGTGVDVGPNSQAEGVQTRERAWKTELVLPGPLAGQVRLQPRNAQLPLGEAVELVTDTWLVGKSPGS